MPDIDLPACRTEFEAASRKPQLAEAWFYDWGQRLIDALSRAICERDEALSWIELAGERSGDHSILAATITAANKWLDGLDGKASNAAMREEVSPPPSPPEIVLSKPDKNGRSHCDNGYVRKSHYRNGKWVACNSYGAPLTDVQKVNALYFDTPLEAARALQELGEGSGATNA